MKELSQPQISLVSGGDAQWWFDLFIDATGLAPVPTVGTFNPFPVKLVPIQNITGQPVYKPGPTGSVWGA